MKIKLNLTVNGKKITTFIPPHWRLIDLLREGLDLTGTKEGCGKGECGSCLILMDGKLVNSCLVMAFQAQNKEIITIEGLNENKEINPIQKSFIKHWAIQCGFCTPGFIMATYYLIKKNPNPSREEIKEALSGNLCRCTGYAQIIKAVEEIALKK